MAVGPIDSLGPISMCSRPLAQLVGVSAEVAQGKSQLVWVRCGPGNDPFELRQVIANGADFD